jgi:hypothetical protein
MTETPTPTRKSFWSRKEKAGKPTRIQKLPSSQKSDYARLEREAKSFKVELKFLIAERKQQRHREKQERQQVSLIPDEEAQKRDWTDELADPAREQQQQIDDKEVNEAWAEAAQEIEQRYALFS